LRAGQHVLDLGAAPGSWSMYAAERIGTSGKLLAVDLDPLAVALPPWARVLQADVRELGPEELAAFAPYQVVLSDMAPRTTGNRPGDAWRSAELYGVALDLAARWLAPGGTFVGKIFMGEGFEEQRRRTSERFTDVRVLRPDTTRPNSVELFIVGRGSRAHPSD
jgi:23S rRNA (uridine2552-2'-O)-methyltransferase